MNRSQELIVWVSLSIILTIVVMTLLMVGLENAHRDFEYEQCKMFSELSRNVEVDFKFDCGLILKHGVIDIVSVNASINPFAPRSSYNTGNTRK